MTRVAAVFALAAVVPLVFSADADDLDDVLEAALLPARA